MNSRSVFVLVAVVAALARGGQPAYAGCTIRVTGVAFGGYDVFASAPLDSAGSVVYSCDRPDHRIRITLSTGSSGTYATRTMRQGADVLDYNLFIGGLTTVWGDGTAGTDYYFRNNPPNSRPVSVTVFGRIPPGQDVRPGPYGDTIQVQIDF